MRIDVDKYLHKTYFIGFMRSGLTAFIGLFFLPLIVAEIGLNNYGIVSIVNIFSGLVGVLDMGVSKAMIITVGKQHNSDDENKVITFSAFINAFMVVVFGFVVYCLIRVDFDFFGKDLPFSRGFVNYMVIVGYVSFVLMMIINYVYGLLEAFFMADKIHYSIFLSVLLGNIFLYGAGVLQSTIEITVLMPVLGQLIALLFGLYYVIIKIKPRIIIGDKKLMFELLSLALRLFSVNVLNLIVVPVNKYLIVAYTGSTASLGVFEVAYKIALALRGLINNISQPFLGVFSKMHNDMVGMYVMVKKNSLLSFFVYVIMGFIFYMLGDELLVYVGLNAVADNFDIVLVMLLGLSFSAVSEICYKAFIGIGKIREMILLKGVVPMLNFLIIYLYSQEVSFLQKVVYSYSFSVFLSSLLILIFVIKYLYNFKNQNV